MSVSWDPEWPRFVYGHGADGVGVQAQSICLSSAVRMGLVAWSQTFESAGLEPVTIVTSVPLEGRTWCLAFRSQRFRPPNEPRGYRLRSFAAAPSEAVREGRCSVSQLLANLPDLHAQGDLALPEDSVAGACEAWMVVPWSTLMRGHSISLDVTPTSLTTATTIVDLLPPGERARVSIVAGVRPDETSSLPAPTIVIGGPASTSYVIGVETPSVDPLVRWFRLVLSPLLPLAASEVGHAIARETAEWSRLGVDAHRRRDVGARLALVSRWASQRLPGAPPRALVDDLVELAGEASVQARLFALPMIDWGAVLDAAQRYGLGGPSPVLAALAATRDLGVDVHAALALITAAPSVGMRADYAAAIALEIMVCLRARRVLELTPILDGPASRESSEGGRRGWARSIGRSLGVKQPSLRSKLGALLRGAPSSQVGRFVQLGATTLLGDVGSSSALPWHQWAHRDGRSLLESFIGRPRASALGPATTWALQRIVGEESR